MANDVKLGESRLSGHLAALFSVLIWGTTMIATKLLLADFQPIEIMFYRGAICVLTLTALYPHRLVLKERRQEWYFALAGLFGVTLYALFENVALQHTAASNVGVIVATAPFFSALIAVRTPEGKGLRASFFIGFAVAIAGIALISFYGGQAVAINPLGDLLALLAAMSWALYCWFMQKIGALGYHPVQSTRRVFLYGLLFMLPAMLLFDFRFGFDRLAKGAYLPMLLYLGVGASALCFVTWNVAIKALGTVKTTVYIYAVPVVTVISSALVLGEAVTPVRALGTALTLLGLVVSQSDALFGKAARSGASGSPGGK